MAHGRSHLADTSGRPSRSRSVSCFQSSSFPALPPSPVTTPVVSSWWIVGHNLAVSHRGRTPQPCIPRVNPAWHGNISTTLLKSEIDDYVTPGCKNLHGSDGGVPGSVDSFAPFPGRCNRRLPSMSNRLVYRRSAAEVLHPLVAGFHGITDEDWSAWTVTPTLITGISIACGSPMSHRIALDIHKAAADAAGWLGQTASKMLGLEPILRNCRIMGFKPKRLYRKKTIMSWYVLSIGLKFAANWAINNVTG